jgi:hypothetical protein
MSDTKTEIKEAFKSKSSDAIRTILLSYFKSVNYYHKVYEKPAVESIRQGETDEENDVVAVAKEIFDV